jgi:hypothetical protein
LLIVSSLMLLSTNHSIAEGNEPGRAFSVNDQYWEVSFHGGFIWAHSKALDHLVQSHFPLYQVSMWQKTPGTRDWHHHYAFPDIGLGFWGGSLGYPGVLGNAYALMPQIRLPLVTGKRTELSIIHGAGLGYITKPFDRLSNYRSHAVGSHLNIALQSRISLTMTTSPQSRLSVGLGLSHFSNGAIKKPNLGINIPTACLSLAFNRARPQALAESDDVSGSGSLTPPTGADIMMAEVRPQARTMILSVYAGGGLSRFDHRDETLFAAWSLSTTLSRPLSVKRRLGLGGDFFYNYADKLIRDPVTMEIRAAGHLLKAGVHLAYEQVFGRLDFVFQTGYYLYAREKGHGMIYNRAGLRYQFAGGYLFGLGLKTHTFTAEFFELAVGYRFGQPGVNPVKRP